jgi:hypothetical protein
MKGVLMTACGKIVLRNWRKSYLNLQASRQRK